MSNAPYTAAQLPPSSPPGNHGRTRAAWATTGIVLGGALVAALGVAFAVPWVFWVGIGIVVAGAVVGKVMQVLGMGQPRRRSDPGEPSDSLR
jgi:hypothetical protein